MCVCVSVSVCEQVGQQCLQVVALRLGRVEDLHGVQATRHAQ